MFHFTITESCSTFGKLRLSGGSNATEGRVEICDGAVWGTVCDNSWDSNNAQVVCRQMGFLADGAIARTNAYFGRGVGPIRIDNVQCRGSESSLLSCTHSTFHNCGHSQDAGVTCAGIQCFDG